MPYWLFLVTLGLFGLMFGSFANVVIWRLPRGESVSHPPSACPKCATRIAWYDNVPVVSWIVLGAKCRSCGEPISWRYPAVELLSGALWVLAGVKFGIAPAAVTAVTMFYLLMILSFIDFDTMTLPNPLVGLLAGAGLVAALLGQLTAIEAGPLAGFGPGILAQPLVVAIVGMLAGAGVSFAIAGAYALVRRTEGLGFGMGDVKLLGAMGLYLGPFVLLAFFLGSLFGAVSGVIAAQREGSMRVRIPFGPWLALGGVVTALLGPTMLGAYLSLFR